MKGRLITNGVLSLVSSIGWILLISAFVGAVNKATEYDLSGYKIEKSTAIALGGTLLIGMLLIIFTGIPLLVMGIVTLAMEKSPSATGLTIASGILSILGGVFFAGAIVSFIAAAKV